MKSVGKYAPVFLKKKLEVKLVGGSFLLPRACALALFIVVFGSLQTFKEKNVIERLIAFAV